jgi:hypothetical protein
MIYTIGHKESYAQALKDNGKVIKVGKSGISDRFPEGYEGGYAFYSLEDSEKRISEEYSKNNFVPFGLKADWEKDTEASKDGWWHNLLNDSEIIFL